EVTALALSPDQRELAVADKSGWIWFWALPRGEKRPPIKEATGFTIHCLAFSGDGRRLAVGSSGGEVTIWDRQKQRSLVPCHGSSWDVYALAFSPDGTLLASGGRNPIELWDAATGRLLLELDSGDYIAGLTFSRDAKKLAVGAITHFSSGRVYVWDFQYNRAIQILRGLVGRV